MGRRRIVDNYTDLPHMISQGLAPLLVLPVNGKYILGVYKGISLNLIYS